MVWYSLTNYPPHRIEDFLGLIPSFIEEGDPRPAREQINERYAHGGGWRALPGWTLGDDLSITYEDDPPLTAVAFTRLRGETIAVYPHAWVAVIGPGSKFEVARCD